MVADVRQAWHPQSLVARGCQLFVLVGAKPSAGQARLPPEHQEPTVPPQGHLQALPIHFAIPQSKWEATEALRAQHLSRKRRGFALTVPSLTGRSVHSFGGEAAYYEHYSASFFAVTARKLGWDCLRHYEVILSGAVPFLLGIDRLPPGTMASFPRAVVRRAMRLPGVPSEEEVLARLGRGELPELRWEAFDLGAYAALRGELLRHAERRLLTPHLAALVVPRRPRARVLLHARRFRPGVMPEELDYMLALLAVGLIESGHEVYAAPGLPDVLFNDFRGNTRMYYGRGFTYAGVVPRQYQVVDASNASGPWDYYILSTRSNWCFPDAFPEAVRDASVVVAVDGNDIVTPEPCTPPPEANLLFARESERYAQGLSLGSL